VAVIYESGSWPMVSAVFQSSRQDDVYNRGERIYGMVPAGGEALGISLEVRRLECWQITSMTNNNL
jgi:hypothetical protein